jgi:hypothetical protein
MQVLDLDDLHRRAPPDCGIGIRLLSPMIMRRDPSMLNRDPIDAELPFYSIVSRLLDERRARRRPASSAGGAQVYPIAAGGR